VIQAREDFQDLQAVDLAGLQAVAVVVALVARHRAVAEVLADLRVAAVVAEESAEDDKIFY
jgi:hypothetical protein